MKEFIMLYQEVISGIIYGVTGQLIRVEVEMRNGLPYFTMVGYLSKESTEAKERVASALRSVGHPLPAMKITVNLSPANIRKNGTAFDFPIAVAFLACLGKIPSKELNRTCILGELGLNGTIHGVGYCLPIVMEAKKQGIHRFFIAEEDSDSVEEMEDVEIIFMRRLSDIFHYFDGMMEKSGRKNKKWKKKPMEEDFLDMKGQQHLKRAIEIAITGRHHILLVGSPGSGKTMAIKRVPSILYPLTKQERMEVQSIYDAAGIVRNLLDDRQPFRTPHTSISKAAFLGGGHLPKAGEITLAHHGILVLDELMEYRPECLESLRQPLEERKISIYRAGHPMIFPSDFQMIAAMNPCPCGYALEDGKCRCTYHQKKQYLKKLSGAILDRFDMILTVVNEEEPSNLLEESSKMIRERVIQNVEKEHQLLSGTDYHFFSEIRPADMENLCPLSKKCIEVLKMAYCMKKVTKRGIWKLKKLAMTIALMEGETKIQEHHLMEALSFRNTGFISEVSGDGR